MGAAILCRAYKFSGEKKFLEPALKAARYSAAQQRADVSWDYAQSTKYRWIDNFHTGYNLCALQSISSCGETTEFEAHIRRGFEFYRNNFFAESGAAKYFHSHSYPFDIHSAAQSTITLLMFKELDENNICLAHAVIKWALANMWNEQGLFYYQIQPYFKNKIPYIRWAQAWMLYTLSTLLEYYA